MAKRKPDPLPPVLVGDKLYRGKSFPRQLAEALAEPLGPQRVAWLLEAARRDIEATKILLESAERALSSAEKKLKAEA